MAGGLAFVLIALFRRSLRAIRNLEALGAAIALAALLLVVGRGSTVTFDGDPESFAWLALPLGAAFVLLAASTVVAHRAGSEEHARDSSEEGARPVGGRV